MGICHAQTVLSSHERARGHVRLVWNCAWHTPTKPGIKPCPCLELLSMRGVLESGPAAQITSGPHLATPRGGFRAQFRSEARTV